MFARSPAARAPSRDLLAQMCGELAHRGPDERGLYRDARAGLAHTRLSIIDLASGQQPLSNEDGSLWLVFNGEIFNYVELRAELLASGHRFRTQSDTEVIVHAYEEWGEGAFERFNGQWAVALYDRNAKELVLCRDRYGVRPLYYVEHDGRVYFGSEIAAILSAPEIPRAIDPHGIADTFTFWSPIAPRTFFEGVRELEPGHARIYRDGGRVDDRAYFTPSYDEDASFMRIEEAVEAVSAALERAVALRMLRADVPVGSYLSGGLDSSLVVALAMRAVARPFHTFSLRFEDGALDETRHQRLVAEHVGSVHHEIVATRGDVAALFPRVVRHAERPLLRTAPAPMQLLSQLVREHGIKVVLTGEGADEMFAGYDIFREAKVRRFWARRPESELRPRLIERLYPYLQRSPTSARAMARRFFGRDLHRPEARGFSHGPRWSSTAALSRLLGADVKRAIEEHDPVSRVLDSLPAAYASWSPLARDQHLECLTLLSPYLLSAQGDRMLMASSVEGRFPFLDKDVIALANRLPHRFKLNVLDEKHVLKRIGREILPREIVRRAKQPYRAPDASIFCGPDAPEWVRELTTPRALAAHGLFDVGAVEMLLAKCRARVGQGALSNTDDMALVGVLSTQLLVHELIERRSARPPAATIETSIEQ